MRPSSSTSSSTSRSTSRSTGRSTGALRKRAARCVLAASTLLGGVVLAPTPAQAVADESPFTATAGTPGWALLDSDDAQTEPAPFRLMQATDRLDRETGEVSLVVRTSDLLLSGAGTSAQNVTVTYTLERASADGSWLALDEVRRQATFDRLHLMAIEGPAFETSFLGRFRVHYRVAWAREDGSLIGSSEAVPRVAQDATCATSYVVCTTLAGSVEVTDLARYPIAGALGVQIQPDGRRAPWIASSEYAASSGVFRTMSSAATYVKQAYPTPAPQTAQVTYTLQRLGAAGTWEEFRASTTSVRVAMDASVVVPGHSFYLPLEYTNREAVYRMVYSVSWSLLDSDRVIRTLELTPDSSARSVCANTILTCSATGSGTIRTPLG